MIYETKEKEQYHETEQRRTITNASLTDGSSKTMNMCRQLTMKNSVQFYYWIHHYLTVIMILST